MNKNTLIDYLVLITLILEDIINKSWYKKNSNYTRIIWNLRMLLLCMNISNNKTCLNNPYRNQLSLFEFLYREISF